MGTSRQNSCRVRRAISDDSGSQFSEKRNDFVIGGIANVSLCGETIAKNACSCVLPATGASIDLITAGARQALIQASLSTDRLTINLITGRVSDSRRTIAVC